MRFGSITKRRPQAGKAGNRKSGRGLRLARRQLILEPLEQRHLLSVVTISADDPVGNGSNNGIADQFRLVRNGDDLEIYIDGNLAATHALADVTKVEVQGSSDDDVLIIDLSGGSFATTIEFDGALLGPNLGEDSLILLGDPGSVIGRISYFAGALFGDGANDGRIVIDPDGNAGAGAGYPGKAVTWSGDEMFVQFYNLSPVHDIVPAAQLDIFATHAAETIEIVDGDTSLGVQTGQVRASTFENYFFANKTRVTVNSLNGGDEFILNYNVSIPGLQSLELYGNELTRGARLINPLDQGAQTFHILATGPGPQFNRLYGGRGADLFTNASTNYLDNLRSNVEIREEEGLGAIFLSDREDLTGDEILLTGDLIRGAAPADIFIYFALTENIFFEATSGDDLITILSTFTDPVTPFTYRISGGPGSDTFRVGSFGSPSSPNWAPYGSGVNQLSNIRGELILIPGPVGDTGEDRLYIDDSGRTVGYTGAQIVDSAGGSVLDRTTSLLGFGGAATIRYEYTPGDSMLEYLYIFTSSGADTLTVNATSALNTEINLGPGNDASTLYINGDGLGGNNIFLGHTGTDRFVLNILNDLGASSPIPLTGLRIEGNAPDGNSSLRDVLEIVDTGGLPRSVNFSYQAAGGLTVDGFAVPIDVLSMETVKYLGDGTSDDFITITGTPLDDAITVAPVSWDAVLVFLGGDPWDGPAEGSFFDQYPGLAGGGLGPDLSLTGLGAVLVDAAGGAANHVYVYAPSESDLVDPSTTIDPFGFGTGVIVPGWGWGAADDYIAVLDSGVYISNNVWGSLLPIYLNTGSLVQSDPNAFGLVVNAGFEPLPGMWGIADEITVTPSTNFAILINGGDPDPSFAPQGDWLNLTVDGPVNLWADKGSPTQVWFGTTGTLGVAFSSIENVFFAGTTGVVNLYGDANDPAIDQNDLFEVVGTGYQSFRVSINGSAPIDFYGVTHLNVFGDDELLTPSAGPNDIDTLILTPYATNAPQGWGIQISFDEGNPADGTTAVPDLIVYNALPGISENIEIVPTGPGTGQLRVTNAADGSLITVVNFISNTGFIINGNDGTAGDLDRLTLRGTTGDDILTVVDAQNVAVTGLYSVQFTNFGVIYLEGDDGYDVFEVSPSALQVVIDGGTPDGVIQSDGDVVIIWPGAASFHLILGAGGDNGTVQITGAAPVTFRRIEGFAVNGTLYTLPDLKEPNDSLAQATILGSIPHITIQDLTIHTTAVGVTNDDYFQVTARDTGGLLINVLFAADGVSGNQVGGTLSAELLDGAGNVLATGAAVSGGVQIAAPVVSQQRYYIRVFSTDGDPNRYTLEIENFAAPTPTAVVMHPAYDTGRNDSDRITNADNPVVLIQAWLSDLAAKGIPVLNAAQVAAGQPGIAVEVFVNGISAGFADPFGPSNNVFSFALPSGLLAAGLAGGYTGNPTAYGWLNFVSAAVRVRDPMGTIASRELGVPLSVTYDPNAPDASLLTLTLAPGSDSGIPGDGVTGVRQPTFQGRAEVNSIVRLFANGQLVGQTLAGSDLSDGVPGNGLGSFSILAAPLTDGTYTFAITVEDVAGNITDLASSPTYVLQIDTTPPQRPTIDLVDADDTGWSSLDDVTRLATVRVRVSGEVGTNAVIKDGEAVIDSFVFGAPLETRSLTLGHGPHPLTVEVTDTAGNRTQSEQLLITVDLEVPPPATISLAPYSDSGIPGDGITNVNAPAFTGLAEANARIRLYVNGTLAGQTYVHSDESDRDPGNGLGVWEITVEPLADGDYTIYVVVEDQAGNVSDQSEAILITVDTSAPQRPTLDLQDADDTGWSDLDNVTIGDPLLLPVVGTVDLRFSADLGSTVLIKDGNTVIVGPFVFDASFDVTSDGVADGFGLITVDFNLVETAYNIPAEGPHPLSIESIDPAGNVSQSEVLLVTIDFTPPPASAPALAGYSDTGIVGDRITSIAAPAFTGQAEANAVVRLYVQPVGSQIFYLAGQTYAHSDESDGNPANGLGVWEITVEPLADGEYLVWTEVEDRAGNISLAADNLRLATRITVDTTPPQIPTIDLVDATDTGWSDKDNVTRGVFGPSFALGTVWVRISAEDNTLVLIKDGEVVIDSFIFDAAFDNTDLVPGDNFGIRLIDFVANESIFGIPAEGPHPLTVEAIDAAGNFRQSEQLLVTIDFTPPVALTVPDMLPDSDTGQFNDDDVTRLNNPAFRGYGEANSLVRLYVVNALGQEQLVGQGLVGSDESDGISGDGLGIWEVTIEPLDDGVYYIFAIYEDQAGNISARPQDLQTESLRFEIDTYAPNMPYLDLITVHDSGRSNVDNITNLAELTFTASSSDPNDGLHLDPYNPRNLRFRIYDRFEGGGDVLIYDSGLVTSTTVTASLLSLSEGVHNLKLEVEDRAGNISPDFLLTVIVDRTPPPASFGLPGDLTDGLHPDSDSGVPGLPGLNIDRITSDTTPTVWGRAEANAVIRLFADLNGNGRVDATDVFLGQTTAIPLDGNAAEPNGYWEITSIVDLNDPRIFPRDGLRTLLIQATDVAGNTSPGDAERQLNLWIDTQGPRVTGVFITSAPGYNLFDPKPTSGPTPLVDELSIRVEDLPVRDVDWLYDALARDGAGLFALSPGHFSVVGDASGVIPILSVSYIPDTLTPGQPARGTIVLTFCQRDAAGRIIAGAPLPDDRFTLTISDSLSDPAGNRLDGESNVREPHEAPTFPSGDGTPGGSFVARFTVDSRPEIGVWAAGSVWIDTNGNGVFDPNNLDFVNRDLVYTLGFTSDDIFAGNFSGLAGNGDVAPPVADGFDKLAAYGRINGSFRWLIDINNDGVPDLNIVDPAGVNGLPFSGRFDDNDANGDEVGVVTAFPPNGQPSFWYFDTNHDYRVDYVLQSQLRGYPIVGDFDGDGFDDLATFMDDIFYIDLANGVRRGWDGVADHTFRFGFIGILERPVAADMDMDGFTDIGLWVPNRTGQTPTEGGEWYWLISNGESVLNRIQNGRIEFSPKPLGNDLYYRFGNQYALPLVGNFDPPVSVRSTSSTSAVQLTGTEGNDVLEFVAGDSAANWVVRLNGVVQTLDGTVTSLIVDLKGGNDQVIFTGTAGSDVVEVEPGRFVLTGSGYSLTVLNAEQLQANLGAGSDSATLTGSAGNDTLVASPGSVQLVGEGLNVQITGVEDVTATGGAGGTEDTATLYDSAGDDLADITPERAILSGSGYRMEIRGFDLTHVVARNGGNDLATFMGSTGTDDFIARPDFTSMTLADGTFYRAKGFGQVEIFGPAGNQSVLKFVDSAGDDTFEGTPIVSTLRGPGYQIVAHHIPYVHAYSRSGGVDTAILTGSEFAERVVIDDNFVRMFSDSYTVRAKGFRVNIVDTLTGDDTVKILDTRGDDTFTGEPNRLTYQTRKQEFRVENVTSVDVYGNRGGNDIAYLLDSPYNDTLTANPTRAILTGPGYTLRVTAFDQVHAYSRGGQDVAELTGSPGDDQVIGDPTNLRLLGTNFLIRTKNFADVTVNTGGGRDQASARLSSAVDSVFANGVETIIQQGTAARWNLRAFARVEVRGVSANDLAEIWNGQILHQELDLNGNPLPEPDAAAMLLLNDVSQVRVRSNAPPRDDLIEGLGQNLKFRW